MYFVHHQFKGNICLQLRFFFFLLNLASAIWSFGVKNASISSHASSFLMCLLFIWHSSRLSFTSLYIWHFCWGAQCNWERISENVLDGTFWRKNVFLRGRALRMDFPDTTFSLLRMAFGGDWDIIREYPPPPPLSCLQRLQPGFDTCYQQHCPVVLFPVQETVMVCHTVLGGLSVGAEGALWPWWALVCALEKPCNCSFTSCTLPPLAPEV